MVARRLRVTLLGALTIWTPLFLAGLGIWFFAVALPSVQHAPTQPPNQLLASLIESIVALLLTVATLVVLGATTVYYAVHIVKNERLSERKKALWSLCNVVLGPLAMPLYWYFHV